MPFDPTDPNSLAANQYVSPLAGMAQDRATGMLNQPQLKVFAKPQAAPFQDAGTNFTSPIMPSQTQLGNMMPGTLSMAEGGLAKNEGDGLAGIKNQIRAEFQKRGLDFDKFVSNPVVMREVGKAMENEGRGGDTMLAHINPKEAALLKERGGSGTINPNTGLPEFDNPSMGSYDAPSSSSDYSGYTGGSNIGSYSGSGNTTYSPSTGGTTTSPTMGGYLSTSGGGGKTVARPVSPTPATAGEIYAQNLSKSGAVTSLPTSTTSPFFSTSSATNAPKPVSTQNTVSPVGFTGNPLTMGQAQPIAAQTPSPQPTFANVDPTTGMPFGGSNLSGIGTLAAASAIGGEAPASTYAPSVSPIDPSISPVGLSDIDFSSMNAGVAPNAYVPGGISNFAAAPTDPGYTDIGLTAMRMAANQPTGAGYRSQGTEFNLGKLNEFDPVAQTQGATILNRMMDEGYAPGFDPYGVGRTMAEQAALKAAAGNNLTAAPGRSFHNYGLAMDVENLPEQGYRDLSRIAREEGWGWGGSLDPAHVQAAPWGAGAMQTAMALGAQPFTGEGRIPESPTALQSALNTVSNIASELFGAKPAAAEEAPQRDVLGDLYTRTEPFGGEEIMSPFAGYASPEMSFPPRSQQQMLNALGISGSAIPIENQIPAAQIAGSGVFPSNVPVLGTQPIPVAGKIGIDPQTGKDLFVDINSNEFVIDAGTGARQYTKFSTATPASRVFTAPDISPTTIAPYVPKTPAPIIAGLPSISKEEGRAPGMSSGLTGFEAALGTTPIEQAAIATSPAQTTDLAELMGTIPQGNYLLSGLDSITKTIPNTARVDVPKAIDIYNPIIASPEQVYKGLVEKLTGTPENRTGTWTPGEIDPETGLPKTGVATWPTPNFSKMTDEEIKNYNESLEKYGPAMRLTPQKEITSAMPDLGPYQFADYGVGPASFADLTPLTPVTPQDATTAPTAPQPRITTGITSPLSLAAQEGISRQELPAGSRMTSEQLKEFGVYKDTLQPGETVRQDFNAAYADATKRGLDTFQWTNPATGKTDFYKSGASDSDLPAKNANEASLLQSSDKQISELENAGMIANGMSKEDYAAQMGVPVEDVKTRITTQFGPPMVEYYVKSIGESLAGMTGGKSNLEGAMNLFSLTSPIGILGILGKNLYNNYMSGSSETSPIDTSQTEMAFNRPSEGGRNNRIATTPSPSKLGKTAPITKPAANTAPTSDSSLYDMPTSGGFADRSFVGIPIDYENYGYGGEHQYYTKAARGGPISAMRKR